MLAFLFNFLEILIIVILNVYDGVIIIATFFDFELLFILLCRFQVFNVAPTVNSPY